MNSPNPFVVELGFTPTPAAIVAAISRHPRSFFLDTSLPSSQGGRYSYVGFNPSRWVEDPYEIWPCLSQERSAPFFSGGLVGYKAYEGSPSGFGLYDEVVVLDHQDNKTYLASRLPWKEATRKIQRVKELLTHENFSPPLNPQARMEVYPRFKPYEEKIKRIKNYLRDGHIYQLNYTHSFEALTNQNPAELYLKLRQVSPAPFGAFFNTGDDFILSSSPECLLWHEGKDVLSRPIKGTAKRDGRNQKQDEELKEKLFSSPKDRAELLMIVDLVRHDLGRVCDYGSIEVKDLFSIDSFAQVHHMMASVYGRLKEPYSVLDAFHSLFPGGSVTGAPKKRAMEIICELEEGRRGFYTGSVGYFSPSQSCVNLAIRTLTQRGEKVRFHAGGGIVVDSDPASEFTELWVKASGIIQSLGGEEFYEDLYQRATSA